MPSHFMYQAIFYFDFKHVLFVYIVKKKRILTKNFVDFQNFQKFNENRILNGDKYLKFWSFPGATWGPT